MKFDLKRTFAISCLLVAFLCPLVLVAQDDEKPTFPLETIYAKRKKNTTRTLFKNFKISLSTGYGTTFLRHKLDSFGIIQRPSVAPSIYRLGTAMDPMYSNWINKGTLDTLAVQPESFIVNSDTAKLGFKGRAFNIPLNLSIHYEFLKRFRIGGGLSYELMSLRTFQPISFTDKIKNFQPANATGFMRKYYGMAGASFYRIDNYLFTGDLQIGSFKPGKNFDNQNIKKGIYFNLGVTAERELSEYVRLFARPSFDFKKYTLTLPGSEDSPIAHKMRAAYLQIGLTYSIPELPRCFHKDCKIQMNHAHGNKEYRSRVHPFYKKQNPGYGENHPELIKYKGKNKRKLNPY